jgi:hypothetical protein
MIRPQVSALFAILFSKAAEDLGAFSSGSSNQLDPKEKQATVLKRAIWRDIGRHSWKITPASAAAVITSITLVAGNIKWNLGLSLESQSGQV